MELTVKQEHLAKAFNIIGKIASDKTSLPILSNVLLRTNGSRLLIAATDLEIAVSQNIGAKIEKVGEIAIPARLVTEFLSSLPRENVSLKVDGEHLLIKCGNYKSRINGVMSNDFPDLPLVEKAGAKKISLPTELFKSAVSQTEFTASTDTSRPALTGIYWHTFEDFLYLAATDGYRLSERKVMECDEEISAIVPTGALREVLRSINDSTEEIEIYIDEHQFEFHVDDVVIVSRLIDGNFVDYRRLIPKDTENKVKIAKDEFSRVVKIAALFARDSGGSVTLKADKESSKLSIHSIASEFGENTSEAEAEISSDGEVTLNPTYILKGISSVQGKEIEFGFSGKLAPTLMRSPSDEDYIHIIMPVKS